MTFRVVLSPEAQQQLRHLRTFIRRASSAAVATNFISDLVRYSQSLDTFPNRGSVRNNLRPEVRVIGFRGRVSIHFEVVETVVIILAYTYAGRNWTDDYDC